MRATRPCTVYYREQRVESAGPSAAAGATGLRRGSHDPGTQPPPPSVRGTRGAVEHHLPNTIATRPPFGLTNSGSMAQKNKCAGGPRDPISCSRAVNRARASPDSDRRCQRRRGRWPVWEHTARVSVAVSAAAVIKGHVADAVLACAGTAAAGAVPTFRPPRCAIRYGGCVGRSPPLSAATAGRWCGRRARSLYRRPSFSLPDWRSGRWRPMRLPRPAPSSRSSLFRPPAGRRWGRRRCRGGACFLRRPPTCMSTCYMQA